MSQENKKTYVFLCSVLFLLVGIGDLWGLIDFHLILGKGELYDIGFVIFIFLFIAWFCQNKNNLKTEKKFSVYELTPIILLVTYCTIEGIALVFRGEQGIVQTIMVVRELWYIIILLPFVFLKYDIKELIQLITIFDLIGCIVYIVEMFTGPLTLLHVGGRMDVGLYRFYSDNPIFPYFLCPLLIYALAKHTYILGKKIDILALIFFITTMFLRLSKMAFAALLVGCVIAFVTCKGCNKKTIAKQVGWLVIAMGGIIILGVLCVPQMFSYFYEGVIGLLHVFDPTVHSNLTYRTETMAERWNFLEANRRVLFGMGPLHNDSTVFKGAAVNPANTGIIASDIAYGTILMRYGVLGIVIYILSLILFAFTMFRKSNIFAKSLALYCIAILIAAICGHSALCFGAFLKLGILIGITYKALAQETEGKLL